MGFDKVTFDIIVGKIKKCQMININLKDFQRYVSHSYIVIVCLLVSLPN